MTEENTITASSGDVFKDLGLGTVEEFTRKRLKEVSNRLNSIEEERNALVAEHRQLVKTAKAIGIHPRARSNTKNNTGKIMADHIVEVLAEGPLKYADIATALAKKGIHFRIPSTLASHLTILKRKNLISNSEFGGPWSLVSENK